MPLKKSTHYENSKNAEKGNLKLDLLVGGYY